MRPGYRTHRDQRDGFGVECISVDPQPSGSGWRVTWLWTCNSREGAANVPSSAAAERLRRHLTNGTTAFRLRQYLKEHNA